MWVATLHTNAESSLLHLEEITQLERLIHSVMFTASSTWYSPKIFNTLYKYTVYLHSQFGNTDAHHQGVEIPRWVTVISLFLFYLVNSSVGFRAKAKVNEHSEIHFVQGGNPGTCAQRPGREEWVSLGAVPRYVQSSFVVSERPEKLTTCFFLHFGGMTSQKHAKAIAPCLPKFTKRGDVVTKHVFAGNSLDRAAALCRGDRREIRLVTHACCVVETWSDYTYAVCGNDLQIYYVDLHAWYTYLRFDLIDSTMSYSIIHCLLWNQLLGRCMTWTKIR